MHQAGPTTLTASLDRPVRHPADNPGTVGASDLRHLARVVGGLKDRIRALLHLAPGQRVLDVGCGPGLDAVSVAARVRPGGLVVGLDYDRVMVEETCRLAARSGAGVRVSATIANAAWIPHASDAFDRCYCERVLQHVPDPAGVIREMVRVVRPGGVIVAADTDWATLSIDTPEVEAERALVRFVGATLCNGYAGRQLRRLLMDEGLVDVHVEPWPVVWTDYAAFRATSLSLLDMDRRALGAYALSDAALAALNETWVDADRRGAFFASAAIVVARGWKAGSISPGRRLDREES